MRLCSRDTIERVAVLSGNQSGHAAHASGRSEERANRATSIDFLKAALQSRATASNLPRRDFGRQLETGDRADRRRVGVGIFDADGTRRTVARIVKQPPDKGMRVEEQPHVSLRHLLAVEGICAFPGLQLVLGQRIEETDVRDLAAKVRKCARHARLFRCASTGTSFTAGLLRRAMMISSPASARATRSDSSVFA